MASVISTQGQRRSGRGRAILRASDSPSLKIRSPKLLPESWPPTQGSHHGPADPPGVDPQVSAREDPFSGCPSYPHPTPAEAPRQRVPPKFIKMAFPKADLYQGVRLAGERFAWNRRGIGLGKST